MLETDIDVEGEPKPDAPLEFNLSLQSIPFKVTDKDGRVHTYTINEIDGKDRDAFANFTLSRAAKAGPQAGAISNFSNLFATLLHYAVLDDKGERIPVTVIQTWPAKMQKVLFEKAQELNGLEKEGTEDAAKNS